MTARHRPPDALRRTVTAAGGRPRAGRRDRAARARRTGGHHRQGRRDRQPLGLSATGYLVWSATVKAVPVSTAFAYKYPKKDASGNVTWESGTNRAYTTGGSSGYTVSDTWK
ncbi:carbohydrate-binding module family 20 domain-containing protein [Streptomyces griseoviridis]|uniref:carbohydrate-binding module family 20 domain-containing protein n=1 Tax=Streptomyces griseoviridis TaxID=45398 RepID=UPI003F577A6B